MITISNIKWMILSQPAKVGSGKNKKIIIFPTTQGDLQDQFESNNFSSNSCPVFQKVKFTSGFQKRAGKFNLNF